MTQNESIKYRSIGRVVPRRVGEDHLLVPVSGIAAGENVIFSVNETADFMWAHLSAGRDVADTAREVAHVFEVDFDSALADCETYVKQLVDQKLLEPSCG